MNPATCPPDILAACGASPPLSPVPSTPTPTRCAQARDPEQHSITSVSFAPYIGRVVSFLLECRGDYEFSFIGVPSPSDPSTITDIAILKQTVNRALTAPDLDSFIGTIEKFPGAQKTILYWFHTHPPGVTSPTGTDWATLAHLTSPTRPVFMGILVRDKERTTHGTIRFALPSTTINDGNGLFVHDSRVPITFDEATDTLPLIDFPAWLAHFDSLVTRPAPDPSPHYGLGWSSSFRDTHGPSSLAMNADELGEDDGPTSVWDPEIDDIATSFLFDFNDDPSLLSSINEYYDLPKSSRKAVRRCMLDYLEIRSIEGNHDQILTVMIPPKSGAPSPKRDECARFLYTAR